MTNDIVESLVERLYAAFNDPGFMGLGGTDEEAVLQALWDAERNHLMREVDALYNARYAETELSLKDELDDELSGEDFEKAMRLYNDGMADTQKPTVSGRKVAVHGTMTPRAPVNVRTFFNNIIVDWENSEYKTDYGVERTDITKESWENAVWDTLDYLYNKSPFQTARAILDAIESSGKTLTIYVEKAAYLNPETDVWEGANSHATATDPLAATRKGGTPEGKTPGTGGGIGGGSDAFIQFTPHNWDPVSSSASLKARDEALLHELVHSLRQMRGLEDEVLVTAPLDFLKESIDENEDTNTDTDIDTDTDKEKEKDPNTNPSSQWYPVQEEFFTVLITNIYRSEKGRVGVRRDYKYDDEVMSPPMSNAAHFASAWKLQLHYLCKDMPDVCRRIAGALGSFNPIFETYRLNDRYPPGAARNAPLDF